MEFISNNNKGMIWGLLQENNIFDGLETDKFDRIRTMFDDTIASININNKLMTLLEKNKLAMDILINKIKDEKTKPNNSIQMVYKAEDIQNRRNQDFNMKLKSFYSYLAYGTFFFFFKAFFMETIMATFRLMGFCHVLHANYALRLR